ncbi:hypothetical protein ACPA9J_24020 [Pseudomonas aeruginosa]
MTSSPVTPSAVDDAPDWPAAFVRRYPTPATGRTRTSPKPWPPAPRAIRGGSRSRRRPAAQLCRPAPALPPPGSRTAPGRPSHMATR